MSSSQPVRTRTRRARIAALAGVGVAAAALALTMSPFDRSPDDAGLAAYGTAPQGFLPAAQAPAAPGGPDQRRPGRPPRALGESGRLPDHVTVFDNQLPAVTKLDPALLEALRRAATDAARDGVEFDIASGWRSPEYQAQLLRKAIGEYGSAEEAARWVATPETSAHVSGDAVDIGPAKAEKWLSTHGAEYGLCQIYRNEPWHYELRPEAVDAGCPPLYADPTQDPRMQ